MKNITIKNVSLLKIEGSRGSYLIHIDGIHWATAHVKPSGGNGNQHILRYPSGNSIKDIELPRGYEFNAFVRSKPVRQRNGDRDDQETAIKKRTVDLYNRERIESPQVRADRLKAQQEENQRANAERTRKESWTRDGLISLSKRTDLTDMEVFAVKNAYRECFCADMPEQVTA